MCAGSAGQPAEACHKFGVGWELRDGYCVVASCAEDTSCLAFGVGWESLGGTCVVSGCTAEKPRPADTTCLAFGVGWEPLGGTCVVSPCAAYIDEQAAPGRERRGQVL